MVDGDSTPFAAPLQQGIDKAKHTCGTLGHPLGIMMAQGLSRQDAERVKRVPDIPAAV